MANRATRLTDDFIRPLNMIDLEFAPGRFGSAKDKAVIDAWRALRGEYGDGPKDDAPPAEFHSWNMRINDRLVSLLFAMSKSLGYDFSEEELRRGVYYPKGRVDLEQNQLAILAGLKRIVEGELSLSMRITEIPGSPEAAALQLEMFKKNIGAYDPGSGAMRVRIEDGKTG
jgi:hypothetical protein